MSHLSLTLEDIQLIKSEMKSIIELKVNGESVKDIIKDYNKTYSGGSGFKSSALLNIGMKDPSIQYITMDNNPSTNNRPHPKLSTSMIVKFWKKSKKKH